MGEELLVTITSDTPISGDEGEVVTHQLRQELMGIVGVAVAPAVAGSGSGSVDRSNVHLLVGVIGATIFTGRIGYKMLGEALQNWHERNRDKTVVVQLPDGSEVEPVQVVEAARSAE